MENTSCVVPIVRVTQWFSIFNNLLLQLDLLQIILCQTSVMEGTLCTL
jgi:hypothetical protein